MWYVNIKFWEREDSDNMIHIQEQVQQQESSQVQSDNLRRLQSQKEELEKQIDREKQRQNNQHQNVRYQFVLLSYLTAWRF